MESTAGKWVVAHTGRFGRLLDRTPEEWHQWGFDTTQQALARMDELRAGLPDVGNILPSIVRNMPGALQQASRFAAEQSLQIARRPLNGIRRGVRGAAETIASPLTHHMSEQVDQVMQQLDLPTRLLPGGSSPEVVAATTDVLQLHVRGAYLHHVVPHFISRGTDALRSAARTTHRLGRHAHALTPSAGGAEDKVSALAVDVQEFLRAVGVGLQISSHTLERLGPRVSKMLGDRHIALARHPRHDEILRSHGIDPTALGEFAQILGRAWGEVLRHPERKPEIEASVQRLIDAYKLRIVLNPQLPSGRDPQSQ